MLGTSTVDGQDAYQVEATPKPEAAVVWGRVLYSVRKGDFMPLKQEYFSERGELVRVLSFSEVRQLGGRTLPTRWEMRPLAKPGNVTTVLLKEAVFDRPVDEAVFTQSHLQNP
ncbi:Outer membrane lipoprotein-sorting protein [compost metagenome]